MKVTDPEIIRSGERDLIDSVKDDLDWGAVREILKKKINLSSVNTTGGEIIVHENKVAFRVDFTVNMELSLMFDRDGNHIPDEEELPDNGSFFGADPMGVEEETPNADKGAESEGEGDEESVIELNEFASEDEVLDLDEFASEDPVLDLNEIDLNGDEKGEGLDEDIDEILKESREFWENKKE